ncbi:MAG: hypothetical protein HYS19_04530 [Nitrosomonadales bacterium]|nr:hypothetical protein [Nitrosomonadales bacterium]
MNRAFTVIHALGLMLVVFSITYIMPVITSVIYADSPLFFDFLLAMICTATLGSLMWLVTRHYKGELSPR